MVPSLDYHNRLLLFLSMHFIDCEVRTEVILNVESFIDIKIDPLREHRAGYFDLQLKFDPFVRALMGHLEVAACHWDVELSQV